MIIKIKPQLRNYRPSVVREGDKLTIGSEQFDFSPLQENQRLPEEALESEWFPSDIYRHEGRLVVTLVVPFHIKNKGALTKEWPDIFVEQDGEVSLPDFGEPTAPEEEPEEEDVEEDTYDHADGNEGDTSNV